MSGITRRQFAASAVTSGAIVALGCLGVTGRADASVLRPPGGQDEASFQAKCIRCGRCREACPERCIVDGKIEQGIYAVRTPVMNYRRGHCTFCDLCIEACPTNALSSFNPDIEAIGVAVVDPEECIAFANGTCGVCADACPYGAITINSDKVPVVDVSMCNGCGVCEQICPSSSYQSYSGSGRCGINVEVEGARS